MNPALTIIIVNWNGEQFLPASLRSLAKYPPSVPYEVIVVDNASGDGSRRWLASDEAESIFPDGVFKFMLSDENLGFGRANNLAAQQSSGKLLFLLNPDASVLEGTLDILIETVNRESDIGMSVPRVRNLDDSVEPSVWGVPSPFQIISEGLGLHRLVPRRIRGEWLLSRHWTYDRRIDVPLASGCAMMIQAKAFNSVGGFNPDTFMYGEDWELCFCLRKSGWRIVIEPKAVVIHLGGQSSKQIWNRIERSVKEETAAVEFQERCLSPLRVAMNAIARLLVLGVRYVLRIIRRKDTRYFNEIIPIYYGAFKRSAHRFLENK